MGCEATVFDRCLADLLTTHWGQESGVYSQTISWLRCLLSFALLRCPIMCIRKSRSSAHHPVPRPLDLSVVLAESRLINQICIINRFSIISLLFLFSQADSTTSYFTIILAMVTNDDCDF